MGGKLLQGQDDKGSTESDEGTQSGAPSGGQSVSESAITSKSEEFTPGSPTERGFNPTKK